MFCIDGTGCEDGRLNRFAMADLYPRILLVANCVAMETVTLAGNVTETTTETLLHYHDTPRQTRDAARTSR